MNTLWSGVNILRSIILSGPRRLAQIAMAGARWDPCSSSTIEYGNFLGGTQAFHGLRCVHTHTGESINIWIISYIYVDLEWTLLLLKVIRHSHTRSHYWKSSQTPIIRSAPEGKPISIFRPFHEEKTRDCALREVFSIISSKLDFSSILFIEGFL